MTGLSMWKIEMPQKQGCIFRIKKGSYIDKVLENVVSYNNCTVSIIKI